LWLQQRRGKPTTRELGQHEGGIRNLLDHLQPERALPGNDGGWSKGGSIHQPLLRDQPLDSCCASSWLLPTIRTSAPKAADFVELVLRHQRDMQITARMLELRGMGKRTAMIAGRRRDHRHAPSPQRSARQRHSRRHAA